MDAEGLTILNQYREAGLAVRSFLMDVETYDTYARFGTNLDVNGNSIKISSRRDLATLDDAERALYKRLTDPRLSRFPLNFGGGPCDRQAAITVSS